MVSIKIPSHSHTAVIDSPQSTLLISRDNMPNERSVCLDLVYVNSPNIVAFVFHVI